MRRLRSKTMPEPDWDAMAEEWYAWKGSDAPWLWHEAWQQWENGDMDEAGTNNKAGKGKKKLGKKKQRQPESVAEELEGEEDAKPKEVSFARRPVPTSEAAYARWKAIKLAFEDQVAIYVHHPSKYQDI